MNVYIYNYVPELFCGGSGGQKWCCKKLFVYVVGLENRDQIVVYVFTKESSLYDYREIYLSIFRRSNNRTSASLKRRH